MARNAAIVEERVSRIAPGERLLRGQWPWRYHWPDAVHDDVHARPLALKAERDAEEVAMGLHRIETRQEAKASAGSAGGTGVSGTGRRRGRPPKTPPPQRNKADRMDLEH